MSLLTVLKYGIVSQGGIIPFPSGCTAYYAFSVGSGTTITDSIGSSNGSTNANWTTSGKRGNGISFPDASEKNITIASTSAVRFSGSFSISLWVYPSANQSQTERFIIHKSVYPYNYRIDYPSDKFNFACAIDGNWNAVTTTETWARQNWHHLVCIYDASAGKKLYVNNVLKASNANTGTLTNNTAALTMGRYAGGNGYDYAGRVDEVAFWNRVLTSTEVSNLYNSGNGLFY
jgi:MSHA biogenesis protein MshQ